MPNDEGDEGETGIIILQYEVSTVILLLSAPLNDTLITDQGQLSYQQDQHTNNSVKPLSSILMENIQIDKAKSDSIKTFVTLDNI